VVATLASESGRRVWPRNDFYRIGEGCGAAEQRYGLRATGERDRTAAKRPTRAETEKAIRTGGQVPVRVALRREVRAAAGGAGSVEAFFARLRDVGLMVRERRSELAGALTGYAVALAGRVGERGVPVFYSGGKLAADLTLPKLAARWAPAGQPGPMGCPVETPAGPGPDRRPVTAGCLPSSGPRCGPRRSTPPAGRAPRSAPTAMTRRGRRTRRGPVRTFLPRQPG